MTQETGRSSFSQDREPDAGAQAQAALLLLESLIHGLIDNGTLTKAQAAEAIRDAMEVKAASAAEEKEPAATLNKSIMLLSNMLHSIDAH